MSALMKFGDMIFMAHDTIYKTDVEATRDLQKNLGHDPCFRSTRLINCTADCQWRYHCRQPVTHLQYEN